MTNFTIRLITVEDVKTFVREIVLFECESELVQGRYVVDAKSIIGIFSLDLNRPVDLQLHTEDETVLADVKNKLGQFMVNE